MIENDKKLDVIKEKRSPSATLIFWTAIVVICLVAANSGYEFSLGILHFGPAK